MPHAKRWILSARAVQNPPLIHAIYFIFSFNRQTTPLRRDRGQTPRPRLGTRGLTPVPKALVVLVLALSVVGICSVLSEVMLVKKVLWHSLYSRVECHGVKELDDEHHYRLEKFKACRTFQFCHA